MIDRQASFTNPSNRLICPTDGAGPLLRPVTSSAARGAADRLKYGMLEAKKRGDSRRLTERIGDKARSQLKNNTSALVQTRDAAKKVPRRPFPGTEYPRTGSGRRLAFVKWAVDRTNPLTARVAVNHIWLRHFGSPEWKMCSTLDFALSRPCNRIYWTGWRLSSWRTIKA